MTWLYFRRDVFAFAAIIVWPLSCFSFFLATSNPAYAKYNEGISFSSRHKLTAYAILASMTNMFRTTMMVIAAIGAAAIVILALQDLGSHQRPQRAEEPFDFFDVIIGPPMRRDLRRRLCIPGTLACNPPPTTPAERMPAQAKQEMKRALLRLKMNARRFNRKAGGEDYTYEYAMEEYNQVGTSPGRFDNSDYTKVSVSSSGVTSPRGHPSTVYLYNKISQMLRRAMKNPSKLGNYRFVYSRRNGLPRYVMLEHNGKSLRVSARMLNVLDGNSSPTK